MKQYLTQNNLLLALGVLVLIALGVFGYYKYTQPTKYIANKEYGSEKKTDKDGIDVYYFYVDWCPHCKKAAPVWEELKAAMPSVNGRPIRYHKVNCEKTDENGPQLADKFDVSSYPTIKMVNHKQVVEYDAKPEVNTLKQFIRTAA